MKVTPEQLVKMLEDDQIKDNPGYISFSLKNISLNIKKRDVVGNVIQEWIGEYLKSKGIEFSVGKNNQMPPDYFLDPDDQTKNLLEIKTFNYDASPAFDIADFKMYAKELLDKPYVLFSYYLIFGYRMDEKTGAVKIVDFWLRHVWETTGPSKAWPLNLQIKRNEVHKIRPRPFWNESAVIFRSKEDFISAIGETIYRNNSTRTAYNNWVGNFEASYYKFYRRPIDVPKWSEISNGYMVSLFTKDH